MATSLLPLRDVLLRMGGKRSAHYIAMRRGLMVRPVALSERTRRYPDFEIDAIIAARKTATLGAMA